MKTQLHLTKQLFSSSLLLSVFLLIGAVAIAQSPKRNERYMIRQIVDLNDPDHPERYGFMDANGKVVVQPVFYKLRPYSEGLAAFQDFTKGKDSYEKWGFIDMSGKIIIAAKYEDVEAFSDGKAQVAANGEYFDIDPEGNRIPDENYSGEGDTEEPVAEEEYVEENTITEETVEEEPSAELVYNWNSGGDQAEGIYMYDGSNSGWGRLVTSMNPSFSVVDERTYDGLFRIAKVVDGKTRYGFMDTTGREVIPITFQFAYGFQEGRSWVVQDGHWGCIDNTGTWLIKPAYPLKGTVSVTPESYLYATSSIANRMDTYSTLGGLTLVVLDASTSEGRVGWIDEKGKIVWEEKIPVE